MSVIVGIDLGTTSSLVSCFQSDKCILIPNALGEVLTPSVVSVLGDEILVGKAAKERLYTHPDVTVSAFKRFMGTDKKYRLGRFSFTPIELSSLIIKSLKADAEAFLQETVMEAVISVPAYFNDKQRRATKQAGELAGLIVERLISEPTAAALAHGLHVGNKELKFLVMDLGGGTYDVSVVDLFENIMEVRAVAGNNFLGGEDFDELLAKHFIAKQGFRRLTSKEYAIVKEKAEVCKKALTESDSASMNVTLDGRQYSACIDNALLEKIGEPVLEQLKKPIIRAVRDSRLRLDDLDHIILVGGSTKMPIVRAYATRYFGRFPLSQINPDEAVGLGAGVCAAMKARNASLKENFMTDICPFTLGTDVIHEDEYGKKTDGHFLPIIERSTTIPCSKVKTLYSVTDKQKVINVGIYQGESRIVANNQKLGELRISIPPMPAGEAKIDVRYTYDINGILEVEVTSLDSGEFKRELIFDSNVGVSREEIEESFRRLAHLKIHPREQGQNRYLLAKAERLYEETLSDMREEIANQIRRFESVLDRQEPDEIKAAAEKFSEFLEIVENRMN